MKYLATVRRFRFKWRAICRSDHFWWPVKVVNLVNLFVAQHGSGLILLSGKTGADARALLFARFRGRELSPSTINTWVVAKLLFARCPAVGPNSPTAAAQDFRSRAKLLFVPGGRIRVDLAVPLPVAGIGRPPLPRTVVADLAVNRICSNFAPMIFAP